MPKEANEGLLAWVQSNGLDTYGAYIPGEQVRKVLGLEMPVVGTLKDFNEITLAELQGIGYVRDALLKHGKYLKGERGDYRVLLPSENAEQVDRYREAAAQKIKRAALLEKTTPTQPNDDVRAKAQREARLHMRKEDLKASERHTRMIRGKKNDGSRPAAG